MFLFHVGERLLLKSVKIEDNPFLLVVRGGDTNPSPTSKIKFLMLQGSRGGGILGEAYLGQISY
jgi:hypothetical protein